ncbi:phosphoribosyltransferase [Candidatus Parcubacteria bacterium]|nr:phosphoribosyltransferase [Candidatus Parcubacteria bacterium]
MKTLLTIPVSSTQEEVVSMLRKVGAVKTDGHFVGTSGEHMSVYVNKDALLTHPQETSRMGELFATMSKDLPIDVVVSPAMGAIILGHWTAYHLLRITGRPVLSVYTEKDKNENQMFKRDYDKIVEGKNVLLIEDTTATGLSVRRSLKSIVEAGGNVLRACVMVNRDTKNITSEAVGAPLSWLAEIPAETYPEDDCPLCKAHIPIHTTVGHGKKFLEKQTR